MIFYYLLAGRPPWEQLNGLKAVIKAATEADRPLVDRSWDSELAVLMRRCWEEDPTSRPTFAIILDELHDYCHCHCQKELRVWILCISNIKDRREKEEMIDAVKVRRNWTKALYSWYTYHWTFDSRLFYPILAETKSLIFHFLGQLHLLRLQFFLWLQAGFRTWFRRMLPNRYSWDCAFVP